MNNRLFEKVMNEGVKCCYYQDIAVLSKPSRVVEVCTFMATVFSAATVMPQSSDDYTDTNEQYDNLNRPYFSAVSQGEFSTVLNDTNFSILSISHPNTTRKGRDDRRKPVKHTDGAGLPSSSKAHSKPPPKVPLISEDDFVALSLQALQGISSFIYKSDTIQQKQLHICNFVLLGRSATSLSKYQLAFSETFYIRLLLGSAQEAYLTLSSDRGQLALGAALGDLLLLHDASISMLHEKLHNEERTSPSSLWSTTTLHRSILCQLFRIIAPPELCDAFQKVFSTPLHSTKQNTDEKMNQFALLDLLVSRYMKPYTWMSGYRNNIGWAILDSLLVHLEKARKMTSNTSNLSVPSYHSEVSRSPVSSFHMPYQSGEDEVLSDSLAKVVVILFLVKRVSIPLLSQLQRRLFCLESDFETSAPVDEVSAPEASRVARSALDKLDVYHMSVQKRTAKDGADVLVYSTVRNGNSPRRNRSSTGSPVRSPVRSPRRSPVRTPIRGRADGSGSVRQLNFNTPNRGGGFTDAMEGFENTLVGDEEGAVLQGSVVPSLLLALERAINPIRLICHAGEATHSSDLAHTRGSNDLAIYETKNVRTTAAPKVSANMDFIDASSPLRLTDEEKYALDSAVLSACRDSDAALLVPLNVTDLQGLDLLVASAMARFSAIRRAVLAEINAWVSPEPLIIDHKALQIAMKKKFKNKFRGGHRDLLDPLEDGVKSDDERTTPGTDAGSFDFLPDAVSGIVDRDSVGDASNASAVLGVTAALSAIELNRAESTDADAAAVTDTDTIDVVVGTVDPSIPSEGVDAVTMTDTSETVIEVVSDNDGGRPLGADDVIGEDLGLMVPDPSPSEGAAVSNAAGDGTDLSTQVVVQHVIVEEEDNEEKDGLANGKDVLRSLTSTTYTPALPHTDPVPDPAPSSSSKRTDMSCLGYEIIHPDLRFIDQEMRFRERVTATYSSGLLSLAKANGIVFNPQSTPSSTSSSSSSRGSKGSKGSKSREVAYEEQLREEEGALMLLMQPMQALLDGTLLSAVSWQCRVLDQAALFASISSDGSSRRREGQGRHFNPFGDAAEDDRDGGRRAGRERKNMGGLMWHIDCYEEAFLLSARSDVIRSLVAILIETYAQRHPFSHSQSVFSTQRSRYLTNIRRKTAQDMLNEIKSESEGDVSSEARRRSTINSAASGRSSSSSSVYGVEPMASMLDLWTEYSLKAALVKLKNQRPEAARSLTHVQYSITAIRERSIITDPENSPRASIAASSSSLSPASDSIFSGFGLDRLSIGYTATWPINTMITPALLRVTARATRRLLELAQLTALVRFVWVDTRGRKNTSAVAERQHGAKKAIKGGPTPYPSSSSSASYAAFDRDCSHALRIVQQTILPLSDFTTDRIKSHQLKFRADILDASNHGFLGVTCALMRYAEGVAYSIFADEDGGDIPTGDDEADEARTSDKGNFRDRARARAMSELEGIEEDSSIADLISKVLEACRHVLIMLEMSSIQRSEEEALRGDSSVSMLFESASAQLVPESKKRTQMMARIKDSVRVLLQCRINLFTAAKRVAEEEDQQDALALLMFFNQ